MEKNRFCQSYKKAIPVLFFFFSFFISKAQLLDSLTLDTMTACIDIQEGLKNPDKVIKLVLRKQHLKSFPDDILKFKNLQYLDISKNSIAGLPDSICVLKNLQYFACSKTGLKTIPKEIGKLQNLIYLNLNQNDLEALPPQIGNLDKLQFFDIWSNNFDDYPTTLSGLKSLKVIDLRNILISDETQAYLKSQMPKATVYMSPSCKCKM
ncbi:MAG: leucine-rich repeat domain-containing protein [Bacteroidota bacterium]